MGFINEHELDPVPTGHFISEADLDPTPTATATPESTLTQRGHASGSAPAAPTRTPKKEEGPDPYLQLGKHIAQGFRDFIQPSIDLAMRGMALPQQAIQESIQPAAEKVLGSEAGPPMAQAVASAAAPFTMGIPEGGTRVPPAMEALDPELRVQPPARAQQPGPESVVMPAPFEGQRAIEGPVAEPPPIPLPPDAEVVPPNLNPPAVRPRPQPAPVAKPEVQSIPRSEFDKNYAVHYALGRGATRGIQEQGMRAGWFTPPGVPSYVSPETVQPGEGLFAVHTRDLPPKSGSGTPEEYAPGWEGATSTRYPVSDVPPKLGLHVPPHQVNQVLGVDPQNPNNVLIQPLAHPPEPSQPIPMGRSPLRAIAGPSRLALPAPEKPTETGLPEYFYHGARRGDVKGGRINKGALTTDVDLARDYAGQGGKIYRVKTSDLLNSIDPEMRDLYRKYVAEDFAKEGHVVVEPPWGNGPGVATEEYKQPAAEEATPADAVPKSHPRAAIKGQANVYDMYTERINARPDVFQYKTHADDRGVTRRIDKPYNKDYAKEVEVWYDSKGELGKPGEFYVSHGHHRNGRAHRDNVLTQKVTILDSGNTLSQYGLIPDKTNVSISEARTRGALQNFADEQGTPYDAALFMRENGTTGPEFLEKHDIDLSNQKIDTAVGLSRLSPPLWREVGMGRLDENIAAAIGNGLPGDMENQNALFGAIRKRQEAGSRVTPDWIKARIALGQNAEKIVGSGEGQKRLFGDDEAESTMDQQAEILEYTQKELEADRMGLGRAVRNKQRLEKAKNTTIDVKESKALATEAAEKKQQLMNTVRSMGQGDATKQVLRRFAAHLKQRPKDSKKILDEAYGQMLKALEVDNPTLFNRADPNQGGMFGNEKGGINKEDVLPILGITGMVSPLLALGGAYLFGKTKANDDLNKFEPASSSMPLDTPRWKRIRQAKAEQQIFEQQQSDITQNTKKWLNDARTRPDELDLNPPMYYNPQVEFRLDYHIDRHDRLVDKLNEADRKWKAGQLSDKQYHRIYDLAEPEMNWLNHDQAVLRKQIMHDLEQQLKHIGGKYHG